MFISGSEVKRDLGVLQKENFQNFILQPNPPPWRCGPTLAMASLFLRFLDYTQRRITVGRISLDE